MYTDLIIDVKDISKSFHKKPAVVDLSFQAPRGEVLGFLGPNGTGKTTTIRMLCGLLTPDSGSGTCMGYDIITETALIKSQVGYMTQNFSLYKDLTIYENLDFRARLYGLTDRRKQIMRVMEQLDLTRRKNQLARTLSGGWKQRLALAASVLHQPLLLLLDEPTAGVDPHARRDFWELLHGLASEGTTILLSTHNMDEVERCQRIIYMTQGRVLAQGNLSEIMAQVNLITWEVKGPNLPLLTRQLEAIPAVGLVTTFYQTLHVSSDNKEMLEQAIAPYFKNPNYQWQLTQSSLDDIFIWLTKKQSEYRHD
ncbi:MAG: ABC transporter ATP-binding protein [Gammaproteobacteria bacterium]